MACDRCRGRWTGEEGRRWAPAHPLLDYGGAAAGGPLGGWAVKPGAPGTRVRLRVWKVEEGQDSGGERGGGEGWGRAEG